MQAVRDAMASEWEAWNVSTLSAGRDTSAIASAVLSVEEVMPLCMPTPVEIVAQDRDPAAIADAMLAKAADAARFGHRFTTGPGHDTKLARTLFLRIARRGFAELVARPAFVEALAPAMRDALRDDVKGIATEIENAGARLGRVEAALIRVETVAKETHADVREVLAKVDGMTRAELDELGVLCRIDDPAGQGTMALKSRIFMYLEDIARVADQIETMQDVPARVENARKAAADAVRRFDLAEARACLRDAMEIHRDAVLREPLEQAATMSEQAAEVELLDHNPQQAFALLTAAADSFAIIETLEVARRKARYEDRLYRHGLRYGGSGIALAVDMNRAALMIYTEADHPVNWATTMQNLALALEQQGTRTGGAEGAALLEEAVESYRAALRVRTEANHPVHWAQTMQNLAIALKGQGTRTDGAEGAALLGKAVESYRAALRVLTEADHPVHWAMTRENMAILELVRAGHDTCTDPRPPLEAGLAHVTAALAVYDPEHMPFNHDKATTLRDDLAARLAALPPA